MTDTSTPAIEETKPTTDAPINTNQTTEGAQEILDAGVTEQITQPAITGDAASDVASAPAGPVVADRVAPSAPVTPAPVKGQSKQNQTPAPAQQQKTPEVKKQPEVQKPVPAPALSVLSVTTGQLLLDYVEAMKPRKPVDPKVGARLQAGLYRAIVAIINKLGDDFTPSFTALLKFFEEHANGALHESYVFRFMDIIELSETERKAFLRVINLLKVSAPVKGRELALKQVNLDASLPAPIFTEQGRQRVFNYFNK